MIDVKKYFSFIKFSHTIFALPFALVGLFMGFQYAEMSHIHWGSFVLVIGCMVFARNAAMAFNRLVDRYIDANNVRTSLREIPSGKISERHAKWFVIINVGAFIVCTYYINPLCFYLSPIALAVILGYSYTKRFTPFCHFVLGLGLGLAPVGAFLAVTAVFQWAPVVLGVVVLTWVSGFDIIYALQDETFDRENKLNSLPVWLGGANALRVSEVLHVVSAFLLILFGYMVSLPPMGWIGIILFIGLLFYQHTLVKIQDLSRVNMAFFTANGIASVTLCICILTGWLWG